MKVSVDVSAEYKEPFAVIHTDRVTQEIQQMIDILGAGDSPITALFNEEDLVILKPMEIYMVRVENTETIIYGEKKKYRSRKRLYEMASQLGKGFMQISKSTLDGIVLPIGIVGGSDQQNLILGRGETTDKRQHALIEGTTEGLEKQNLDQVHSLGLSVTLDRDISVPDIYANRDLAPPVPDSPVQHALVLYGCGPEDDSVDPCPEVFLDGILISDAASYFDEHIRSSLPYSHDGVEVRGHPTLCTLKVDNMHMGRTRFCKSFGYFRRILAVHGHLLIVALVESYRFAVIQVYCRINNHFACLSAACICRLFPYSSTNAFSIFIPTLPLFSG